MSRRTVRVVPYVTDIRNALLIKPVAPAGSLGDSDSPATPPSSFNRLLRLAASVTLIRPPLPRRDGCRDDGVGPSGVVHRVSGGVPAGVARDALIRCHADPTTGEDRDGPGGVESCEAACAVVDDGPHHDYQQQAARDAVQDLDMHNLGYQVIRFSHTDDCDNRTLRLLEPGLSVIWFVGCVGWVGWWWCGSGRWCGFRGRIRCRSG